MRFIHIKITCIIAWWQGGVIHDEGLCIVFAPFLSSDQIWRARLVRTPRPSRCLSDVWLCVQAIHSSASAMLGKRWPFCIYQVIAFRFSSVSAQWVTWAGPMASMSLFWQNDTLKVHVLVLVPKLLTVSHGFRRQASGVFCMYSMFSINPAPLSLSMICVEVEFEPEPKSPLVCLSFRGDFLVLEFA